MALKRRRGTLIVDTPKGILVVSHNNKTYGLPGGGVELGENQKQATIRELKEETTLEASHIEFFLTLKPSLTNIKST
jgi:ADP-ribose pyrophosphatase YjhB (NUDIX family)